MSVRTIRALFSEGKTIEVIADTGWIIVKVASVSPTDPEGTEVTSVQMKTRDARKVAAAMTMAADVIEGVVSR